MTTTIDAGPADVDYDTWRRHFDAALDDEDHEIDSDDGVVEGQRFLLIERSVYGGDAYLTTHGSAEDAAAYHDGQENPEDWPIRALWDLATGVEFCSESHTTFHPTGYAWHSLLALANYFAVAA